MTYDPLKDVLILSIHWECIEGLYVFYSIEGSSVIFLCILEFSFVLPTFRELIGDILNFYFY